MARSTHPEFKAPPVNEVAIGLRFEPIADLTLAHFGLFWATVRKEFTESKEAPPLGPIQPILREGGAPLPRLWLIHRDQKSLIQLQPNLFYFNWRRLDDDDIYPRYDTLKPRFDQLYENYTSFLRDNGVSVPQKFSCELTYVNLIPFTLEGNINNPFKDIFPDFVWRNKSGRFLAQPEAVNWQSMFKHPDLDGGISVKIQTARRVKDDVLAFRFEIKAETDLEKSNFDETPHWFDAAHDVIVASFVDLTSDKAQRDLWRRIND